MKTDELVQRAAALTEHLLRIESFSCMETLVATCMLHKVAREKLPIEQRKPEVDVARMFEQAVNRYTEQRGGAMWKGAKRPSYRCPLCQSEIPEMFHEPCCPRRER